MSKKCYAVRREEENIVKLQAAVNELKTEIENRLTTTVKGVKEVMEESMETERRKLNITIHRVKGENAE